MSAATLEYAIEARQAGADDLLGEIPLRYLNMGPVHGDIPGLPFGRKDPVQEFAEPASVLLVPHIAGLSILSDPIAAAVEKRSTFIEDPYRRLFWTGVAAVKLVYGGRAESTEKGEDLHAFHHGVEGIVDGVRFAANDNRQQVHVLGSVFMGGFRMPGIRGWGKLLTRDQESGVYAGFLLVAEGFGMDMRLMPPDVDALDEYWEKTTASSSSWLLQTDVSRRVAQTVYRFQSPKVPDWQAKLIQAISITSLAAMNEELVERAGLTVTAEDERIAHKVDTAIRNINTVVPHAVRRNALPAYFATRNTLKPPIKAGIKAARLVRAHLGDGA